LASLLSGRQDPDGPARSFDLHCLQSLVWIGIRAAGIIWLKGERKTSVMMRAFLNAQYGHYVS
jgi:hypothetical protein